MHWLKSYVECCPFIMLCFGSIGMDSVVSESCFKGTILERSYWNDLKILSELTGELSIISSDHYKIQK